MSFISGLYSFWKIWVRTCFVIENRWLLVKLNNRARVVYVKQTHPVTLHYLFIISLHCGGQKGFLSISANVEKHCMKSLRQYFDTVLHK